MPVAARPAVPLPAVRPPRRPPARGAPRGHTMVELVLVMTIGAVLAAMVTPRVNRAAYDADAGARVVRGALQTAQRLAVAQQCDVVVGFDTAGKRLRVLEDRNGNGQFDATPVAERVTWRPLEPAVRFASPPERVGGGVATGALTSITRRVDLLPSLVFRRDGAASENGEAYVRVVRGETTEWRAVSVQRATGRVEWWARTATPQHEGLWARRGL